jgi:hypothetical protein
MKPRDGVNDANGANELGRIQRWLQAVIVHPDGVAAGVESAQARGEIDVPLAQLESVVLPSRRLSGEERVAIYGRAYYSRLLECMRSVYPMVARTLGDEAFDGLAFGYLQKYPSVSYTLEHLGARFAQYLDETRPDGEADAGKSWIDFLIELARLEWAIGEVFDGPGSEGCEALAAGKLAAIEPQRWPDARLVPAGCLHLLRFDFPLNDYFTALKRDEHPPPPEPAETFLALTRRDYVVRRHALSAVQYEILRSLSAGETVGAAIAGAAQIAHGVDQLAIDLRSWFATWATAGFFVDVR